ncbi:Polyadenylate-binding protein [Arachis hypogaea]|nr:Polyadenylate-binding protein [Arachis hypogaea]
MDPRSPSQLTNGVTTFPLSALSLPLTICHHPFPLNPLFVSHQPPSRLPSPLTSLRITTVLCCFSPLGDDELTTLSDNERKVRRHFSDPQRRRLVFLSRSRRCCPHSSSSSLPLVFFFFFFSSLTSAQAQGRFSGTVAAVLRGCWFMDYSDFLKFFLSFREVRGDCLTSRAIELKNHSLLHGKVIRVMWSRRDPDVRKSGKGNVFVKNLVESIDNAELHDLFQKFGNILSSFGNCFGASNWFRESVDSDTAEKPRERGDRIEVVTN